MMRCLKGVSRYYTITVIGEISLKDTYEELIMSDTINWHNFNEGDIYYTDDDKEYRVVDINHKTRSAILVEE